MNTLKYDAVVIAGRPNVGKSTLFNKLIGRKKALVSDVPGVTRDKNEGYGKIDEFFFRVWDTAGIDETTEMMRNAASHTAEEIRSAQLVLFVIDGKVGVTPEDLERVTWLRKLTDVSKVQLVVNKSENPKKIAVEDNIIYRLGLGEPIYVSAEHNTGLYDVFQKINSCCVYKEQTVPAGGIRIAIAGRPNAGKSTLINRIIKDNRLLTGDMPGVTRDAVDVRWKYKGKDIVFADTAGLRRKNKIMDSVEKISTYGALKYFDSAQVVVLLLDGERGMERQDASIAEAVVQKGKGLVVAINKWDLVAEKQAYLDQMRLFCDRKLNEASKVRIVALSALEDNKFDKLMDACIETYESWTMRVPSSALNSWLADAVAKHPPSLCGKARILNLKFITQVDTAPPTFLINANYADEIERSYLRYLAKSLASCFNFVGVPIKFTFTKNHNPYVSKK